MKILKIIGRIWELISRFARVIVELDDAFLELKGFWDWLTGKEPVEPEKEL